MNTEIKDILAIGNWSKKYTFCFLSILAVLLCVWWGLKQDASHQWIVIAGICGVTVLGVTYLTGQAKIDLSAKIEKP